MSSRVKRPDCPQCSSGNVNFDSLHEDGRRTYHCNSCSNTWDTFPVSKVKKALKSMDSRMEDHVDLGRMINPRTLWHQMKPLIDAIQADLNCDMPWELLHFSREMYQEKKELTPRRLARRWQVATYQFRK